jgi:hypothetical membrane protein
MADMPWWGVVSSTASPVVLIGGWTVAARLQPSSFSPMADTVSALGAIGATDRWVMNVVFLVVGVGYIVTALSLRLAALAGRLILIAGAIAGMLIAVNPEHPGYTSIPHFVCAALGFAGLAGWPLAAWRRGPSAPWALRRAACCWAVAAQLALLGWFVVELVNAGGQVGLAERLVGAAQALWLLAVVVSCRAARSPVTAPTGVPAGN